MAILNSTSALPAAAHPHASPGYGKREAPAQLPPSEQDFAHLPRREAEIAGYLDRLDEGSAIGYKALASVLDGYGQQACRTAIGNLTDHGHIRHVLEHLTAADGCMRWVTRTYWSRTARDDAWWAEFVRDIHGTDVTVRRRSGKATVPGPRVEPADADTPQVPEPERESEADLPSKDPSQPPSPSPSPAYTALARLGRQDPRMTLSGAECAALEPLAAEWLERGASVDHLTRALTAGLPVPVQNPGAIARHRLEKKMPPKQTPAAAEPQGERVTRALMVCPLCDEDERTVNLVRGICEDCRAEFMSPERDVRPGHVPDTFRPARRIDPLPVAQPWHR
ncbi:hypothetical protein ACFVT5_25150 [Streptomyces sp. NPDC058001]|uniref:hypothetical protein n=1 Tax=Streptomyces sp. NPDC058001 TaxID=3346300 RepID=UPI0036EB723F